MPILIVAGAGSVQPVGLEAAGSDAAGAAVGHELHRAHERGRLPVSLRREAVAVGHQPLRGDAGQLLEAV